MIIDTHVHPTKLVDEGWRHDGTPFNGERMLEPTPSPATVEEAAARLGIEAEPRVVAV